MTWTCQRVSQSVVCKHRNPPRTRKCQACGKPRPAKRKPAHMQALELSYEFYEALNGGPNCGICGQEPKLGQRLHRDHDHHTGEPRGILCFRCNAALRPYMTAEWCRSAWSYLLTAQERSI